MFSSNQKLVISGTFDQLQSTLKFVLDHSEDKHICYQITKNKYCLGWMLYNNTGKYYAPDGWVEYKFDFDLNIVSKIIIQELKKMDKKECGYETYDGSCNSNGFLIKPIPNMFSDKWHGIENPFYGIITIERYTNFYAK